MLAFLVTWVLLPLCLANSFVYEDPLAYPRFKVEFTDKTIPESAVFKAPQVVDEETSPLREHQSPLQWRQGSSLFQRPELKLSEKDDRIIMTTTSGQPFVCTIPNATKVDSQASNPSTQLADDKLIETNIEKGLGLLQPLINGCLYFHDRGYWTYEYCHLQHVRQYHIDHVAKGDSSSSEPKIGVSFYLGKTSASQISSTDEGPLQDEKTNIASSQRDSLVPSTSLRRKGDRHLLVQHWGGGTECDLTKRPRTIEIQFQCDDHPQDRIAMFQEIATCQYQMTIATPRLCEAQLLASPPVAQAHTIECNPVVPEHYLSDHEQVTEIEPEHEEASESEEDPEEAAESKAQQTRATEISVSAEKKEEELMTYIAQLTKQVEELQRQVKSSVDAQRNDGQVTFIYLDHLGKLSTGDKGQIEQLLGSSQKKQRQVIHGGSQTSKAQRKNREAYEKNYYSVQ